MDDLAPDAAAEMLELRAETAVIDGQARAAAERREAIRLAHELVHRRHMTVRQAQDALARDHGIRRSTGMLHAYLHTHHCDRCEP